MVFLFMATVILFDYAVACFDHGLHYLYITVKVRYLPYYLTLLKRHLLVINLYFLTELKEDLGNMDDGEDGAEFLEGIGLDRKMFKGLEPQQIKM